MPISLAGSQELYARSRASIAGGANSNFRLGQRPHPLFFVKGDGSRLTDVDGNEYIDYVLGLGPLIFGHSPNFLIGAVAERMASGQMFAAQHLLEVRLAEVVQRVVPCAELVRFSSSGTEAVQAALRVARAFTGRNVIVKFEGHYHGWSDGVLFNTSACLEASGHATRPSVVPMSLGMPSSLMLDVIVLPWNNFDAVRAAFTERGNEIAAVITEPIMCNTSCIMPLDGYLESLRELCTSSGALLIFDEVITGFRLHAGGAQSVFGVRPDLATFAKAMGGGFPISMVAGRRDIMEMIGVGEVVHSGTANGNVMSVAAAWASLERLLDVRVGTIAKLHTIGSRLMNGFRRLNEKFNLGMLVQGPGPVFALSFASGSVITDYRSHVERTDANKLEQFASGMLQRGVRVKTSGLWFVSEAHTDEDVRTTLNAAEEIFQEIDAAGMTIESRL